MVMFQILAPRTMYRYAILLLFVSLDFLLVHPYVLTASKQLRAVGDRCPNSVTSSNTCNCARSRRPAKPAPESSTCGLEASTRGPNQNVVSYTFYGNTSSSYFRGANVTVKSVADSYPGWVMRLYHNINESEMAPLCELWCENDHLDLCDVRNLPYPLCDKSQVFGMFWRTFVLGDPVVGKFIIRDIDAPIMVREVAAVNEWLSSDKTFHIMRDHPYHGIPVLGGLWGGRNTDLKLTRRLREALIGNGTVWMYNYDQILLKKLLWPLAANDSMAHDSFHCRRFNTSRPFPTQRVDNVSWVGHSYEWRTQFQIRTECPVQCRPKDHQDWRYC